ncbi:hypothetical protein C0Q70_03102 [Pomacea canaliculata]|uniref:START domain-containing protein n=1 Tax=Pomacea canaliculata TaxID=400727 RepID=A0A2T7PRS8_POMCA|nr:hypothetical protein C0Q70_03102 [Pomacea canaliculata]
MPDITVSDSTGGEEEGGRMSSVRRTFCLFVTFDLGLMFILWVIYTQLIGETGWRAFMHQVQGYNFTTSLFDTVMMSAVRFTLLLLVYGLFKAKHWWMIAITTTLSSVFLICKIFLFDFQGTNSSINPLSYCLLIISFVLAWVETWFLDFKVLPQERKAAQRLSADVYNYGSVAHSASDRQRLLAPDDAVSTVTNEQYYSPVATPEGSDIEEEGEATDTARASSKQQLEEYSSVAKECWDALWEYLVMDESRWKLETGDSLKEGIIHSQKVKGRGKVYRLQGEVDMDAKSLWEEMVHNINKAPTWNPTLLECKTVAVLDECTDISLNVANQAVGGIVSSRDFVNLRHWGVREGIYLSAGQGVTHPDCPPTKEHIRGYNGPGGWAFKPVPGEPEKSIFIWIMDTDLKGWIPQRLLDQASASVLQQYLKYLQDYVAAFHHRGLSKMGEDDIGNFEWQEDCFMAKPPTSLEALSGKALVPAF